MADIIEEVKITPPEGYEVDAEHSTFEHIVFKQIEKKELPRTWSEFCKNYPVKTGECYVNGNSVILVCTKGNRIPGIHKSTLPSYKMAEAMLALCQLIQLRDCYNEEWQPDYRNAYQCKYAIRIVSDKIVTDTVGITNYILCFKSEELRDAFYNNFKDLIEIAKPLL